MLFSPIAIKVFYHPWVATFIFTPKILISNCILFVVPRGFNKHIGHFFGENNLFICFVFDWLKTFFEETTV